MFGSHERALFIKLIDVSSPSKYLLNYKKRDETKIRTQQYIQLKTGVKEIQLARPQAHALTFSSIYKSLSGNRHRNRPAGVQLKTKEKLSTVLHLSIFKKLLETSF